MADINSANGLETSSTPEARVNQPKALALSSTALESIIAEIGQISETMSEDAGEDVPMTSSGGGAVATTGQSRSGVSPRDQAIANLPRAAVMQREIAKHIKLEIKKLHKEAKRVSRVSQPGGAYHLVQLYSKIHRLNALLKDMYEAGLDIVKRLYIRIFVDKQAI